jgi:hypothetical protein
MAAKKRYAGMINDKSPYERTKKEPGSEMKLPGLKKNELIENPSKRPTVPSPREMSSAFWRYFDSGIRKNSFNSKGGLTAIIGRKTLWL